MAVGSHVLHLGSSWFATTLPGSLDLVFRGPRRKKLWRRHRSQQPDGDGDWSTPFQAMGIFGSCYVDLSAKMRATWISLLLPPGKTGKRPEGDSKLSVRVQTCKAGLRSAFYWTLQHVFLVLWLLDVIGMEFTVINWSPRAPSGDPVVQTRLSSVGSDTGQLYPSNSP